MKKGTKQILGIVIVLIFVLGISYAFLTLTLKGDKELTMTSGSLSLQYEDENAITLEKTYPIRDDVGMELIPYEFRIENTGNVKALYDIILEENEENTLNHVWLKYSLKRNEEEWSIPEKITSLKLKEGLEIDPGKRDSYQLRLWIDEGVGREVENKVFKARVIINSVQSNARTSDLTPPVITLNGSLSESVKQGAEYIDPGVESVIDDRNELNISDVSVSYKYFDGEKTIDVESIDTSRLGVYSIYYKIKDKSGNEGRVIRCVNVYKKNTVGPVIRLNGKSMITLTKGSVYQELGATASKNGEDLTNRIVVSGEVSTEEAGTYEVVYMITDEEENTASVVRVVHVVSISDGFRDQITLDLNGAASDRIHLEGENLGDVTYTSSDESIASVDSDGNVEGHEVGKTVIKVTTSTGVEKEVSITVVKTVVVTYEKLEGVASIERTSDSCEVTTSGGSCEVVLPSIAVKEGYGSCFWTSLRDGTSGSDVGTIVRFREDVTYYAKALDDIKPEWSLVSVSPSSGTIGSNDQFVITFSGTDLGSPVVSTLTVDDIIVKAGTVTVSPSVKTLSEAGDIENGKEYHLTLSGIHTEGVISIRIAADTLKDSSNNGSDDTVFTTGVVVQNNAVSHLLRKSNPITLDYYAATDVQKREMFPFAHTAGAQQAGWSEEELTDYRYIGTNVNNYVRFNGEQWRIIGVFTVEDENGKKEQRMKIIRNGSIGSYNWDNTGSTGANDWSSSFLQQVLNSGPYYHRTTGNCSTAANGSTVACDFSNNGLTVDAKEMVAKTKWYLGGYSQYGSATAVQSYQYERDASAYSGHSINWVGEVGLMYPSDYGYAAMGGSMSCLKNALYKYDSRCKNVDWLYNSTMDQWTITPRSDQLDAVFYIHMNGFSYYNTAASSSQDTAIRPSVYLKTNLSIASGDGSSANPYQLVNGNG